MKSKFYLLTGLLLFTLILFSPHYLKAALPAIPDVGEGVCVSNCGGNTPSFPTTLPSPETDTTSVTSPTPSSSPAQTVVKQVEAVLELDDEAFEKLQEGDYKEALPLIKTAIEILTDTRGKLTTDPEIKKISEDKFEVVTKIDKSILKSINSHKKAASKVEQIIVVIEIKKEELIPKLLKSAKRFLSGGRRFAQTTHAVVAGVRG